MTADVVLPNLLPMVEKSPTETLPNRHPEFARRLQSAMEEADVSITDIKNHLKISYEMARRYSLGQAMPRQQKLDMLAQLVNTTPAYLAYGARPPFGPAPKETKNLPVDESDTYVAEEEVVQYGVPAIERRNLKSRSDTLEISVYDVSASMGDGLLMPEYTNVVERMTVSATWLRSNVKFSSPSSLALITAYGDSMEGTFSDGDMLLVDRGVDEVKIDAVYVLALNDELYIKRLQRRPDGTILMISDNKKYDPYVIKNGELERFRVLGRVLLAWNATRL